MTCYSTQHHADIDAQDCCNDCGQGMADIHHDGCSSPECYRSRCR